MKHIIILLFLFLSLKTWADEKHSLETLPSRWQEINLSGGINGNGYFEVEPSYSYLLTRNLGLTAGANFILGIADDDYYNNFTGEYERRLFDIQTLLFRTSVRFRYPIVRQNKAELFALNIEPGVCAPIGSEKFKANIISDQLGNKKMNWLYFHLKTYITLDLCPIFLSVGYSVTDFSHEVDKFRFTHSGFLQIGYAF